MTTPSQPITGKQVEAEIGLLCQKLGMPLPDIRYSDLPFFGIRSVARWNEGQLTVSLNECSQLDPPVLRHALAVALLLGNPREGRRLQTRILLTVFPVALLAFLALLGRRHFALPVSILLWCGVAVGYTASCAWIMRRMRSRVVTAYSRAMDVTGDAIAALAYVELRRKPAKSGFIGRYEERYRQRMIEQVRMEALRLKLPLGPGEDAAEEH